MGVIVLPDRRLEQPERFTNTIKPSFPAVPDPQSKLWQNMLWYYYPLFGEQNFIYKDNIWEPVTPSVQTGAWGVEPREFGPTSVQNSTSVRRYWWSIGQVSTLKDQATFILDWQYVDIGGSSCFSWGRSDNNSLGYSWGFYVSQSSESQSFFLRNASNSAVSVSAGGTLSQSLGRMKAVVTYDGELLKGFANGAKVGDTPQTGNIDNGAYPIGFNTWSGNTSVRGNWLSCGVSAFCLPDDEAAALSYDPYNFMIRP